jgi:hypothetical protein
VSTATTTSAWRLRIRIAAQAGARRLVHDQRHRERAGCPPERVMSCGRGRTDCPRPASSASISRPVNCCLPSSFGPQPTAGRWTQRFFTGRDSSGRRQGTDHLRNHGSTSAGIASRQYWAAQRPARLRDRCEHLGYHVSTGLFRHLLPSIHKLCGRKKELTRNHP